MIVWQTPSPAVCPRSRAGYCPRPAHPLRRAGADSARPRSGSTRSTAFFSQEGAKAQLHLRARRRSGWSKRYAYCCLPRGCRPAAARKEAASRAVSRPSRTQAASVRRDTTAFELFFSCAFPPLDSIEIYYSISCGGKTDG